MKLQEAIRKGRRAWRFVVNDVWDIELSSLTAMRRLGVKALRVVELVVRGFQEDECPLHASALTFSTLMAIVPVLALSLALARGLGDTETAKNQIRRAVSEWTRSFDDGTAKGGVQESGSLDAEPAAVPPTELASKIEQMVDGAFEKVENINFKALTGVGLILLLLMVIQVMGKVEGSFNRIWGVAVGRSFWRRFTDYLSVLFILPVLVIAASSLPVVDFATRFLEPAAADFVTTLLGSGFLKNVTVLTMTTLCFAFVIMFMPNTRVHARAGLSGGFVTTLLFFGWLWVCAALQVGAARAGRIYGSFAVMPIVLAWVNVSWQIVFFGAEVAFAVQNCGTYRMEQGASKASVLAKLLLALSVLVEAGKAMVGKAPTFDVAAYARARRVSVRFLNDVIDELVRCGYLVEILGCEGCFVLIRAPGTVRVPDVLASILASGVAPEALGLSAPDPRIREAVDVFMSESGRSASGLVTLEALLAESDRVSPN